MTTKPRLLIVEDEVAILTGLIDVFLYHGFEVDNAQDGKTGLEKALKGKYDLLLLDVMLPQIDGYTICNRVRSIDLDQPIIMLTARNSDEDIIQGLTEGADDYVSKPFSVQELVLRAKAVLRRSDKFRRQEALLAIPPDLEIDVKTLKGKRRGGPGGDIVFTRREVEILQYLSAHSDRPISREELLAQVWDYRNTAAIDTRTVDIHIAKLRRKIEQDPSHCRYLVTLRGEGYQLLTPALPEPAV